MTILEKMSLLCKCIILTEPNVKSKSRSIKCKAMQNIYSI